MMPPASRNAGLIAIARLSAPCARAHALVAAVIVAMMPTRTSVPLPNFSIASVWSLKPADHALQDADGRHQFALERLADVLLQVLHFARELLHLAVERAGGFAQRTVDRLRRLHDGVVPDLLHLQIGQGLAVELRLKPRDLFCLCHLGEKAHGAEATGLARLDRQHELLEGLAGTQPFGIHGGGILGDLCEAGGLVQADVRDDELLNAGCGLRCGITHLPYRLDGLLRCGGAVSVRLGERACDSDCALLMRRFLRRLDGPLLGKLDSLVDRLRKQLTSRRALRPSPPSCRRCRARRRAPTWWRRLRCPTGSR